jgi:signal transduction histidine kinase
MAARPISLNPSSDPATASTPQGRHDLPHQPDKLRILVADDNGLNRKILRLLLEAEGHAVTEAGNGISALESLDGERIDAVISDILMPEMDGYRLCYEIRRSEKFGHVPFIVYTASYTSESDEKLAFQFGVDKFIRKPASNNDIVKSLYDVLATAGKRNQKDMKIPAEAAVMREYSQVLVRKLEETIVELSEANNVKDEFLSVMSHELRTPLSVVTGYSSMLRQEQLGPLTSDQAHALNVIQRNSQELYRMIDSIMDATKIETGSMVTEKERVSLRPFLGDIKVGYDCPNPRSIQVQWQFPDSLPSLWTDPRKLRQILTNLVNNAIKFTDEGSVVISAQEKIVTEAGGRQRWVEFRVTDSGIGIPIEEREKIFERFHQVDGSGTRSFEGVGLGLYIVKSFTEMLNGRVSVESDLGKGSTFIVSLPLQIDSNPTFSTRSEIKFFSGCEGEKAL